MRPFPLFSLCLASLTDFKTPRSWRWRAERYMRRSKARLGLEPLETRQLLSVSPASLLNLGQPIADPAAATSSNSSAAPILGDATTQAGAYVDTIVPLTSIPMTQTTGEKPQSKVWRHDNQWFAAFSDPNGTFVWRLDGTAWTPILQLASGSGFKADTKEAGGVTHILLYRPNDLRLASVQYVPGVAGAPGTYELWSARPQMVSVPMSIGAEIATIDIDSTGRMWMASDNTSKIEVRYSDGPYSTWSDPIILATDVGDDDICVVTALPNGTMGVLWSNQNTQRFDFRLHVDGTDPAAWLQDELPGAQGALANLADDHVNVAVGRDGTLYAAVKTTYGGNLPQLGLLVRHPTGGWDPMYPVSGQGTRPIVVLDEAQGRLFVFYTSGDMVYRESPISNIQFSEPKTFIVGHQFDDASSTKQNITDEVVVLASGSGYLSSVKIVTGAPQNQPPVVNAGLDKTLSGPGTTNLDGTVTDDGIPNPPAAVKTTWTKVSGPGTVTFGNAAAIDTTATFSSAGSYILRLTASDAQYSVSDEIAITVNGTVVPPPPGGGGGPGGQSAAFQDGVFPTSSYTGTRDTRMKSTSATNNYGTASKINTSGNPDTAVLLKWDISSLPAGTFIQGAAISFDVTSASPDSYELYEMKKAWNELQATWNVSATGSNWQSPGAQGATDRGTTVLGSVTAAQTDLATINLNAAGIAVVQGWINNPASNNGFILQDFAATSSGLEFRSRETTTFTKRPKLTIFYGTPVNAAPTVDAGPNQTVTHPTNALLDGTITDDGLPNGLGSMVVAWTKISGPGTVTFGNAAAADTTASFSTTGSYVLRLSANDGEYSASDIVTIDVLAAPNQAPVVNAGLDQSLPINVAANLDATVTDDGKPGAPAVLSSNWTKFSGPGTVTFGNAAAVDTTATFSAQGTYVLRLTASDGQFVASDDVTINVTAPVNQTPSVNAGPDKSAFDSNPVSLDGTVTDDGLPAPASVTTTWTKVSGPGSVTFGNASAVDTTASFSALGTYVLRLTANDGLLMSSDDVTVTMQATPATVTQSFQDGVFPTPAYFGTADTEFRPKDALINFGNAGKLDVDGAKDYGSLLQWDVSAIPAGSMVQSVSMTIHVLDQSIDGFEIYEMKRPWAEMQATWNAYATGSNWQTAGAQGSADRGSTVLGVVNATALGSYTVTLNAAGVALVQSWVDSPSSNHGFAIQDYVNGADLLAFRSSEASTPSQRPKLTVAYLPPGAIPASSAESASSATFDDGVAVLLDGSSLSTAPASPAPSVTPSVGAAPVTSSSGNASTTSASGTSNTSATPATSPKSSSTSSTDAVFSSPSLMDDLFDPLAGLSV